MGGDGFKKELGPGLETAAGAAMLATGNPVGAMMLGQGISGMATGAMPTQKPMVPPSGGMPGMPRGGLGGPGGAPGGGPPPGPQVPQPVPMGAMPLGPQGPKGPGGGLAPGGMPGGPQGMPMNPALMKLLFGGGQ